VVNQEFGQAVAEEAFMNELVTVELATTTDDNAPPHVVLSVNGTTQPLMRGVPHQIKRKYVEVLARCKETKYKQNVANPNEPDRIQMIERTALSYPFTVLEDRNPKGSAWLKAVMTEAA
jgi:disulfide oxidoreductase YuzD